MIPVCSRIPHGPTEKCGTSQDLLIWLSKQFSLFGDIFSATIYGSPAYVINAPDYIDHVLRRNWQNYRKGQAIKRIGFLLGNGLMVSEGEFWKKQRRMIQPAFHNEAIENLIDIIARANFTLLGDWERAAKANAQVNITSDLSRMILEAVLRSIFGDEYDEVSPQFSILSKEPARNLEFAQAFRPLRKVIGEIISQRRRLNRTAADMLGMLMGARDPESGDVMPDGQLVNEIITLIVAGHETTASTLNWTWYLLANHPKSDVKLSSELRNAQTSTITQIGDLAHFEYCREIIEETLRLYPAGWLMTRRAVKDDQLGQFFVPAGTEIYISPYLLHRHPALWEDADEFKPERFAPGQTQLRHAMSILPFSAGPRKCIGEMLARVEMQIHLVTIAKHLRMRLAVNVPVEYDVGVNLRSKHDFIMTPEIKN